MAMRPSQTPSGTGPAANPEVMKLRQQVRSLRGVAFGALALSLVATAGASFALYSTLGSQPAKAPVPTATASAGGVATVVKGKPADAGQAPNGTIVLGTPGKNLPVIDIYEDFQCPACAQVEKAMGPQVKALLSAGKVEVRYHVMSFLDSNLGNDASVRSAHGGFCAHEQNKFTAYHDAIFAGQPEKEGVGWTDAQLAAIASASGLDAHAWQECMASGKYAQQVQDANQLSLKSGVRGTPTFKLNGQQMNVNAVLSQGGLAKYIEANS